MKTPNDYLVVELGGKQHVVQTGDIIETERLPAKVDSTFKIDKVLVSVSGGEVELGKPYLKDKFASATLVKNLLGPKVMVSKFKAKTGYRRNNGYRPSLSQVSIDKIN